MVCSFVGSYLTMDQIHQRRQEVSAIYSMAQKIELNIQVTYSPILCNNREKKKCILLHGKLTDTKEKRLVMNISSLILYFN